MYRQVRPVMLWTGIIVLFILLFPLSFACAAEWRVTPVKLYLGKDAKSGAITVTNDGDEKINFQIEAFEWTQDAEGKDKYTETDDIIFFPKIMALEKKMMRE